MIGSCFVRHLNEQGYKNLVLVDCLGSSQKWKNLVGKQFVDLLDKDQLFSWLKDRGRGEIQAIVHLGACSSTTETDASFLLENNYRYTCHLAEWAVEHNVRFLTASSAATYGKGEKGFVDDHKSLQQLCPLNMYGYSKHLFDLWAKNHGILDHIVTLKYFNIFGPNEYHKGRMASTVFHFLPQIQQTAKVRLFRSNDPEQYPDGGQCRDFLYVKDACQMTYDLLCSKEGGVFNIGSGQAQTWNDLVHAIFSALDRPVEIEYIDMPEDLFDSYQNYTKADMTKTDAAITGSKGVAPLSDTVADYIQNHLLIGNKTW